MDKQMTEVEQIEYFLFEDGLVSGERYKERARFWESKGLWHSGYTPVKQQVYLKVMLYKGEDDNLEKTLLSLEQILPHLRPVDGIKEFGVFEYTLSENGVYCVEVKEGVYSLVVYRYHRKSVLKVFDSLRELLKYVQENHYYESSEDNDY